MIRILIVEDSSAMRNFVRSALEAAPELGDDLDIVEAGSGFDALRLLPRSTYDLVITDINMPDINGLELIRFVRQSAHLRRVALLVISTQSSERDRARGLALGADAFLAKPFTPEGLRSAVAQSLGTRQSQSPMGSVPPISQGPISVSGGPISVSGGPISVPGGPASGGPKPQGQGSA